MKKQHLIVLVVAAVFLMSAGSVFAQEKETATKKMQKQMAMSEMSKNPHHFVMMAHRQNVLTFARVLRDLAKDGKIQEIDLARNAFAEIRRSMEKMDQTRKSHMSKMSAEMREKMKPMMEKMQAEQTVVREHILALEKVLQSDSPDAQEVEQHAAGLVSQLEKMGMSEKIPKR